MVAARSGSGTAHVVGLSLGGIIGLNLAVRHPEAVRSLLVSGVPYGTLGWPLKLTNHVLSWLYGRPWGARMVARAFGMPDEESTEAFVGTAERTDPRALQAVMREVATSPLPEGMGEIRLPLLAVVGEKDSAPARQAVEYVKRTIPGAETAVVPAVGHQWNAEERELFSDVVREWIDDGTVDERLRPVG
jgi:pimeloyl-ACP methyl ester carboxylesterase